MIATRTITPQPGEPLGGSLRAPPSKSHAIRALAAAALAGGSSRLRQVPRCGDFLAALGAVQTLGARGTARGDDLLVQGMGSARSSGAGGELDCGESALCQRLFVCITAALGGTWTLRARGSLRRRPTSMLQAPLTQLGARVGSDAPGTLRVTGPLRGGTATLDARDTSQLLSGLLFALPLAALDSRLRVRGLVSRPYVRMSLEVLRSAGIHIEADEPLERLLVPGGQAYAPGDRTVEGDWSGAAFLLVAGAIAGGCRLRGLSPTSQQADRAIASVLESAGARLRWRDGDLELQRGSLRPFRADLRHCPDLGPPLVALATACPGRSTLESIHRLQHKESPRARALTEELGRLGLRTALDGDRLHIWGGRPRAAELHAHGDHRVAMALSVVALSADGPCTIAGAETVSKSYPAFFHDLSALGGNIS